MRFVLVLLALALGPAVFSQTPAARGRAAKLSDAQVERLQALGEAVVVPSDLGSFALDTFAVETEPSAFYLLRYRRPDGVCFTLSGVTEGLGGPDYPPTSRATPIAGIPLEPTPALYWTDAASDPIHLEALGEGTVFSAPLHVDGLYVTLYSANAPPCLALVPAEAGVVLAKLRFLDPADDRSAAFAFEDLYDGRYDGYTLEGADPEALVQGLVGAEGRAPTVERVRETPTRRVYLVTQTGLQDDSIAALRLRVTLRPAGTGWYVAAVERQQRCQSGRGPTGWHAGTCR